MYVISEYYFRHVNDNIITSCHSDSTTRYITIRCRYIKVKRRNKVFRDMDISLIYANIYISLHSRSKKSHDFSIDGFVMDDEHEG